MTEKEKDIRNLSGILKDETIEKGFDSISEIPNSSFDNKKNLSFTMINDQSIETNLRASLNSSSSKKKNDIDKMLPLFIEKLSQNMQNVDFKLSLKSNNKDDENIIKPNIETKQVQNNLVVNSINNQKQKEAISNKYNNININSTNPSANKHINNNFNVIDEIIEEEMFSRNSIVVSNADLELIILESAAESKSSDKFMKKIKSNHHNDKSKEPEKRQLQQKSNNAKSSSNIAPQNSKIKNNIKENKQKIFEENTLTNTLNTENSLPSNEVQTRQNLRTIRVSPDNALRNNLVKIDRQAKSKERQTVSKDVKQDDKCRMPSKTPPKFTNGERIINKESYQTPLNNKESYQTHINYKESYHFNNHNDSVLIKKNKSISPDIKKDYSDKNDKIKTVKISENLKKKEKIEKSDKIFEKENNLKTKKTNVNMNIKKIINTREKELNQTNNIKKEENIPLNKKIKSKILEKKVLESNKSLIISKKELQEKQKMLRNVQNKNIEGFKNLNLDLKDLKDFFEIVHLFSEISNVCTNHSSNMSMVLAKSLRGFIDKNEYDNSINHVKRSSDPSYLKFIHKIQAIKLIQRTWREYKIAHLLEVSVFNKQEIIKKTKLVVIESLMRNPEFTKIISSMANTIQLWKELNSKQPNTRKTAKSLLSHKEDNNYNTSLCEYLPLILNYLNEIKIPSLELEK